ncbi:magnesium transporter CorA family protein [Cellulomonas sp. ATA003]|uniref:magnesium transporter CorA family protein n=1 Tax=Cellulomonas sp. ATA003 TaxID=3073064 RepID=UPI002873DE68|nr:magnesium transporter CorA family protein [Cellulomonas sp. ATA003]WNB86960.1 magnesium transporter CorA family protein [Cellulomonas sp. ATA003]
MRRNRLYRDGELELEDFDCARIDELLAEPGTVVWLHLDAPDDADLTMLTEELGVSRPRAEEFLRTRQRAKVTRHDHDLLMTVYGTRIDPATAELTTSEIGVIASERWMVTLRKTGDLDVDDLRREWDGSSDLAVHGVAFLVHGLLEQIVDTHFDAVQRLDDAIDLVEADLFGGAARDDDVHLRSYAVRKALVGLRRVALPMREVLLASTRRDVHVPDEAMVPYFADVYEQVLRVTEWTETLRDLVTTIQDSTLQIQNNRINEVMRRLSAWAAIFAASTAITGFYGMNVLYPQIESRAGAVTASVLLVVTSLALIVAFRARRWL